MGPQAKGLRVRTQWQSGSEGQLCQLSPPPPPPHSGYRPGADRVQTADVEGEMAQAGSTNIRVGTTILSSRPTVTTHS